MLPVSSCCFDRKGRGRACLWLTSLQSSRTARRSQKLSQRRLAARAVGGHGSVWDFRLYDQPQLEFIVQSVLCMEGSGLFEKYMYFSF